MPLPSIAQHAATYGLVPLKKFGQNFIYDRSLCDKIVKCSSLQANDLVLEIGPGTGGLTRSILAAQPARLIVIEKDTRCLNLLNDLAAIYPNLDIIEGDALDYTVESLLGSGNDKKIHIIANLPYNIGTELIMRWLREAHLISNITVMLQKEVVDRICAPIGNKVYGRLSVITQISCDLKKHFTVSPQAFYPPPKVFSAVVSLTPKIPVIPPRILDTVSYITSLAFGQRRKILKSSLKSLESCCESNNIRFIEALEQFGIDLLWRAENVTPQQYLDLASFCAKQNIINLN